MAERLRDMQEAVGSIPTVPTTGGWSIGRAAVLHAAEMG